MAADALELAVAASGRGALDAATVTKGGRSMVAEAASLGTSGTRADGAATERGLPTRLGTREGTATIKVNAAAAIQSERGLNLLETVAPAGATMASFLACSAFSA